MRVAIYHRDGLLRSLLATVLNDEPDLEVIDVGARGPEPEQLPSRADVIVGDGAVALAIGLDGCCLVDLDKDLAAEPADGLGALLRAIRQPGHLRMGNPAPVDETIGAPPPRVVLSQREVEVLRLVAAGCSAAEIGLRLSISPRTVEANKRRAFKKLGVDGQGAAVASALDHGLFTGSATNRARWRPS